MPSESDAVGLADNTDTESSIPGPSKDTASTSKDTDGSVSREEPSDSLYVLLVKLYHNGDRFAEIQH